MPVRHEIDPERGLVVVRMWGAVTPADILGHYAAVAEDPALRPGLGVLADCREVASVPSFSELGAVANTDARSPVGMRPTRAAVVVASAWLFGIARQFAGLAEPNGIQVMPFYDIDDAIRWLTTSSASSRPNVLGERGAAEGSAIPSVPNETS